MVMHCSNPLWYRDMHKAAGKSYLRSERLHQSIKRPRSDRQVHAHEAPADSINELNTQ